jgi:NADP-dependent aldehyde dehydrogenase
MTHPEPVPDTTEGQLDAVLADAAAAARPLGAMRPRDRAALLVGVADALDAAGDTLVPLAQDESGLPEGRLRGELLRTTVQLRMFADVLTEGAHLRVVIDHADPDASPAPRPDLRRMLVPLGPVLVFAASNFPFAFSVAGGDTASALAAGCPVVLKAHPGHPRLSVRTGEIVAGALRAAGAPEGTFAVIHGVDPGVSALRDPRVRAGAFTGSVNAGRALFDVAAGRDDPIPFFGELGSVNPAFVTAGAVAARGDRIAEGFVGSFTLGAGQFCTKPGLLFLPRGHGLEQALTDAVTAVRPARMLHAKVYEGYRKQSETVRATDGVRTLVAGASDDPAGLSVTPTLLATDAAAFRRHRTLLLEEAFGPQSVVVEYDGEEELLAAAATFTGDLTATVHAEAGEEAVAGPLLETLRERAGRLVFNGWPTGVAVTAAMQHGGPYPSTTCPSHTSVGTAALERFLRPVAYQDVPETLLPEPLRDDNPLGVPQRIDG